MKRVIAVQDAVAMIPEGATIMIGGFMGCGNTHGILDALARSGKGGFTVICNDGAMLQGPDGSECYGVAKLIRNRQVKRLIATHVGLNPEVAQQMNEGTLQVDLLPQGSFVEMIRAGGAGLGGVITPTGVGTLVEDSPLVRDKVNYDGKDYLVMKPLRADVALIGAYKVDKLGNVWYKGSAQNFNRVMATAADIVIVEAEELVKVGEIEPENVMTPGILVDYIVIREGK